MTEPSGERFTGNTPLGSDALASYALSRKQLTQLAELLKLLEHDEHAPTTVRAPREASERHLADSLAGLEIDLIEDGRVLADLGAGAGFPGSPLAVALPRAEVRLIESQRRKCEFLMRMLAAASIENASVVCARAEEWAEGLGANDVVVARALAPQPVVLEYAAPLLRLGGGLVEWRGRRERDEEHAAAAAATALGMELREVRHVQPFAGATDRHLHIWVKTGETPARYPRRAGVARKRPLGA
ncbi:MAG TPA: 16S rRNA (guanine(527)-N(7))-methyltransferase RsmG [Solirubrobacteraceae bacterium]|jgi:16S rRNA (guanine527-N7)-methyltransferase|nr:16S rRNA (guanine(527)-N(7))-methyltransferase RsmG [Solirubrobacteraceae bacterium]